MSNISLPGTSSFVGEFLILLGISQVNTIVVFLNALSMVIGAIYSLFLLNRICFGNITKYIMVYEDLTVREISIQSIILVLILFMGIFPVFFLEFFHFSIDFLLITKYYI